MIHERDTPGDFLQHLAEFRANGMQLSQLESKPVCLLRLCAGLLGRISNPSPAFPAEGLGRAVSCGGVSWPARRGATVQDEPCPGEPSCACPLQISIQGSYRKGF